MPTMRRVAKALKQAAQAFGPGEYTAANKAIVCPHCGGRTFEMTEAQLNKALSSLVRLDWLDETAAVLVCTQCSHLQWFGKRPTRV